MRVTKHEHACLVVDKAEQRIVIDPGSFTTPLLGLDGVVAVVITHEHQDHWTPEHLHRILDKSPDTPIFGPAGVANAASGFQVTVVADGDVHQAGDFELRFFGSRHAVIHESIPVVDNVGVMVDNTLFYPGDAFTVPPDPVNTLAVPAGAPWLKIAEAMDYVSAVSPRRCFPTHQIVLSQIGQRMANDRLRAVTEAGGGEFRPLEPDESMDLSQQRCRSGDQYVRLERAIHCPPSAERCVGQRPQLLHNVRAGTAAASGEKQVIPGGGKIDVDQQVGQSWSL